MRILFLGDSILYGAGSLRGYGVFVKEYVEGHGLGEVLLPNENCMDTRMTASMWRELIDADEDTLRGVDVVHWNNGLWDVCHHFGNARPTVSRELYVKNLIRIADSLREACPRAKIIFATSTPITEYEGAWRSNREICDYNAAAVETLAPLGIKIHDLYTFAASLPASARADDLLHYTDDASRALAGAVLRAIGLDSEDTAS